VERSCLATISSRPRPQTAAYSDTPSSNVSGVIHAGPLQAQGIQLRATVGVGTSEQTFAVGCEQIEDHQLRRDTLLAVQDTAANAGFRPVERHQFGVKTSPVGRSLSSGSKASCSSRAG
jgi:hypothetical protein